MVLVAETFKRVDPKTILFADVIRSPKRNGNYICTYDTIIVGGGPAGSYLGYNLAKKGIQSLILDHSHPREKPCSGTISQQALSKFPILIENTSLSSNVASIHQLISPSGHQIINKIKHPGRIAPISRRKMDQYILNCAIRQGCDFLPEKAINITFSNGLWKIITTQRILYSRILVGADGVNSIVRKTVLEPHRREDLAIGIGCHATGFPEKMSLVHFLKNREGFFWINSLSDICTVGITTRANDASKLRLEFDKLVKLQKPEIKVLRTWSGLVPKASSTGFFDLPCAGKNWLLLGDAAGHVHPITGEGIHYALWSAELASQAIAVSDLRLYDSLWRQEYGKELISGGKKSKLFCKPDKLDNIVQFAGKSSVFANIILDLYTGCLEISRAEKRILLKTPKILFETAAALISAAVS